MKVGHSELLCNKVLLKPGSSVHGIFQARVLEWGAIKRGWDWPSVSKSMGSVGQEIRTF